MEINFDLVLLFLNLIWNYLILQNSFKFQLYILLINFCLYLVQYANIGLFCNKLWNKCRNNSLLVPLMLLLDELFNKNSICVEHTNFKEHFVGITISINQNKFLYEILIEFIEWMILNDTIMSILFIRWNCRWSVFATKIFEISSHCSTWQLDQPLSNMTTFLTVERLALLSMSTVLMLMANMDISLALLYSLLHILVYKLCKSQRIDLSSLLRPKH